MKIINYYRGGTDKLSGFVYDTDTKTYKEFSIKGGLWTKDIMKNGNMYSVSKPAFKIPADIDYFFPTRTDMLKRLNTIQSLGFTEDTTMPLDFGVCIV